MGSDGMEGRRRRRRQSNRERSEHSLPELYSRIPGRREEGVFGDQVPAHILHLSTMLLEGNVGTIGGQAQIPQLEAADMCINMSISLEIGIGIGTGIEIGIGIGIKIGVQASSSDGRIK